MRTTLEDIAEQTRRIAEMQAYLGPLVQQARSEERSWTEIGAALGITRQAAQQSYGKASKVPPMVPNCPVHGWIHSDGRMCTAAEPVN